MFKTIHFPIRGTYYYAANLALDENLLSIGTKLNLMPEPESPYDQHALQIWLVNLPQINSEQTTLTVKQPDVPGLLLGYVPRQLAPLLKKNYLHKALKMPNKTIYCDATIIHCTRLGNRVEIDCCIKIDQPWLLVTQITIITFWLRQLKAIKQFWGYHF